MKKNKGVVIIAVVLACLIGLGYYTSTIVQATSTSQASTDNKKESEGIKLGLDLSGGVSITYQIKEDNPSQKDLNDTLAKLEERAESYSTEYSVYPVGDDRITVEIPGVYDANAVLKDLGSPGTLYFIKHYGSDGAANYTFDSAKGEYVLAKEIDTLLEDGSIVLTGNDVASANAAYDKSQTLNNSEPVVELSFNSDAATVWAQATESAYNNGRDSIGVYYDDHFISVPSVSAVIKDGNCIINGMSNYEEAERLATFIRVGAINLPLEELESNVVGAQLGGKALSGSVMAAGIGLALVMIFMIVMYGLSGCICWTCHLYHISGFIHLLI